MEAGEVGEAVASLLERAASEADSTVTSGSVWYLHGRGDAEPWEIPDRNCWEEVMGQRPSN